MVIVFEKSTSGKEWFQVPKVTDVEVSCINICSALELHVSLIEACF